MMKRWAWVDEFPAAVTVTDAQGRIIEMNRKSCTSFESDGGERLVGTNVLDCHPEPARSTVLRLLQAQESNCYTIEKNGRKKLIYQSPWFEGGKFAGLVEISFEIPAVLPHFKRD